MHAKSLRGSVIPAKAGIQANSAQNKPGFPRARGMTCQAARLWRESQPFSSSLGECKLMDTSW